MASLKGEAPKPMEYEQISALFDKLHDIEFQNIARQSRSLFSARTEHSTLLKQIKGLFASVRMGTTAISK